MSLIYLNIRVLLFTLKDSSVFCINQIGESDDSMRRINPLKSSLVAHTSEVSPGMSLYLGLVFSYRNGVLETFVHLPTKINLPPWVRLQLWLCQLLTITSLKYTWEPRRCAWPRWRPSWDYSAAAAASLQSCPTLSGPIDGSPPGSLVPGILQAQTLEWVAISFSNAWKWKVKVKSLSHVWLFSDPMDCSPPGSSIHGIF